jgi:hypothetical protein
MELEEVKEMVKEVKEMVAAMGDKKEEMSSEEEILREELSQPAAEPIKHNPESGTEKKVNFYSQNRPQTTLDRVMARISNIK